MEKLKSLSIEIKNDEELKDVLKLLEKMGYVFASGNKPLSRHAVYAGTNVTAIDLDEKSYIRVSHNGYIAGYTNDRISATEFLAGNKKECIVIYKDGAETVALDKDTGKKAVAKCSPQDTYDFYTGAKLAFERLTGTEEKPQHVNCKCRLEPKKNYFNGKAVCVVGFDSNFIVGKVYEFVDGKTKDETGCERPFPIDRNRGIEAREPWFKNNFLQLIE